jgi:hypothetical protein
MGFDLETYGRIAGKLEADDLELETSFAERPLAGDVLRCIGYFHDVEHHTTCYLRNLLNTRAHHDPEVTDFLTIWNYEEHWHGHALGRVLQAHGQPAGRRVARMRQRLGWKITASPLGWMALSAATKHFLAVHMTFGVVNEWTTQGGYARLISVADHPTLTELLRRIMKQEGRHIDYYRSKCTELLDGVPAAQRTARIFLRTMWNPVGAKVMPADDTRHLVRTLFSGEDGRAMVRRIDRRIDALPGLAGLHLMQSALAGSR